VAIDGDETTTAAVTGTATAAGDAELGSDRAHRHDDQSQGEQHPQPVRGQNLHPAERRDQHREQGRVEVRVGGVGAVDVGPVEERSCAGPERVEVPMALHIPGGDPVEDETSPRHVQAGGRDQRGRGEQEQHGRPGEPETMGHGGQPCSVRKPLQVVVEHRLGSTGAERGLVGGWLDRSEAGGGERQDPLPEPLLRRRRRRARPPASAAPRRGGIPGRPSSHARSCRHREAARKRPGRRDCTHDRRRDRRQDTVDDSNDGDASGQFTAHRSAGAPATGPRWRPTTR
jgi:hypothetical protein